MKLLQALTDHMIKAGHKYESNSASIKRMYKPEAIRNELGKEKEKYVEDSKQTR